MVFAGIAPILCLQRTYNPSKILRILGFIYKCYRISLFLLFFYRISFQYSRYKPNSPAV